jgi:diguanylate cyclase (GGDEF)-like protein/PAS domain S-box-containing protein
MSDLTGATKDNENGGPARPTLAITGALLTEHFFQHLLESAPDAIVIVDGQGKIVLTNPMVSQIFGYEPEELLGASFQILIPERFQRTIVNATLELLHAAHSYCFVGYSRTHEEFPIEISVSHLDTQEGRYHIVIIRDITERKKVYEDMRAMAAELRRANGKLELLANIDPLTHVFNRRGLQQSLSNALKGCRQEGASICAALIDLDNFKSINDSNGHFTGDLVLKSVVERMKSALRTSDVVGRAGGDEFIVIMPFTRLCDAATVAERIRGKICESSFAILPDDIKVTISCGVVSLPWAISSIEEVLELTKASLKNSKALGKNRVSIGDSNGTLFSETQPQANELLEVLRPNKLYRCAAQAIYDLSDEHVTAYEMLVRGPEGPLAMPTALFQAARENDLMRSVDLNCLKTCLKFSARVEPGLPVQLNLLPSTLIDTPTEVLSSLFEEYGQKDRKYVIEISERKVVMEPSVLQEPLRRLRQKLNIEIAIDDICFGRSSLESLILLDPDMFKLDRAYVDGVSKDLRKQKAVQRLKKIAAALNARIVAEGIEEKDDLLTLKRMGIDNGQGFYWEEPQLL